MDINPARAGAQRTEFFGLYRGSVTDNNDPERRGRLKVLVPQVLPLDEGLHNLADALAAARGLNPASAEPQRILVLRAEQAENTVYWLRANNPLELAAAQQFRLAPGDVIYVDQTGLTRWNKVISQMLPGAITSIGNTAAISSTR